jgi:mannose-1-phosphate guanylyltransferase
MSNRKLKALLLTAGFGTRLSPLTDEWPKCLMPIGERPLLEYWFYFLKNAGVENVLLNLHYLSEKVLDFLNRETFKNFVDSIYEKNLLGTAGTLINNASYFEGYSILLIHADNWTNIGLEKFIEYHFNNKPNQCLITMMTFDSDNPQDCGIVETNSEGVVIAFFEKVAVPPSNKANAAIYLLHPEVLNWLIARPWIKDFSTEVIPNFLGKIATWHNNGNYRDIGTPQLLKKAQLDNKPLINWDNDDTWSINFKHNSIHNKISNIQ